MYILYYFVTYCCLANSECFHKFYAGQLILVTYIRFSCPWV